MDIFLSCVFCVCRVCIVTMAVVFQINAFHMQIRSVLNVLLFQLIEWPPIFFFSIIFDCIFFSIAFRCDAEKK